MHFYSLNAMAYLMHTGIDYLVNSQNLDSRTFTVTFQSKQANSTENEIVLAADDIVEGTEFFRLRIVAARFIGEAAAIFRAQDGLNNTIADVAIEDDDCKFMKTTNHLFTTVARGGGPIIICMSCMDCFLYSCRGQLDYLRAHWSDWGRKRPTGTVC